MTFRMHKAKVQDAEISFIKKLSTYYIEYRSRRPESWLLQGPYQTLCNNSLSHIFLPEGEFLHPSMCMRVGSAWPQHNPQVAKYSSYGTRASSLNSVSDSASQRSSDCTVANSLFSVSGEAALAAVTLLQASLQYSRREDVMILYTNTNYWY